MHKLYGLIFLRLWMLFLSFSSYANSNDPRWAKGEVVLADSSRLLGTLSVNYPLDLLLLKQEGGSIHVYPAHKIKSFVIFDEQTQSHRQFISRTFQSARGLKGEAFFEIVTFGSLTVLRREKRYHRLGPHRSICPEYSDHTFTKSKTKNYVYFVLNGSVLTNFITFQKHLSDEVFAEYSDEINLYMKNKSKRRWKHGDFTYAIRYYNALKLRNESENHRLLFAHPRF